MGWKAGMALAVVLVLVGTAQAGQDTVRARLEAWRDDFNAGRVDRVCELFSPDLRYDYRGFPTRGRDELCAALRRSLSDPARRFHYDLDIAGMVASDSLVAVRLVWTLTVRTPAGEVRTREPGLDVFRLEPDGAWRIVQFLAYEEP